MSGHLSLPLFPERQDELSKCAYCPKLCRATCVVSEMEPREQLTPGGKMKAAFEAARWGSPGAENAQVAWACSACFRCREACDHRNPVAETLTDARAGYVALGQAPASINALFERAPQLRAEHEASIAALRGAAGTQASSRTALLLGCRYARKLPHESRAAIRLAAALAGPVRLLDACCGAWQRSAGSPELASNERVRLGEALSGAERLLVFDPRCALELKQVATPQLPQATTLVELAARHPERFRQLAPGAGEASYRYHDSCALGRGLGLYQPPRELLARVTGAKPAELLEQRALARCSGAGGVLPVSFPEVARAAAERLREEHRALGGGRLVTGCASSLTSLRRAGADAVDLIALLAEGLVADD